MPSRCSVSEFVMWGEGPAIVSNWNEDMRNVLTGMAGASVDGVWAAQGATGMSSTIQAGDVVMWVTATPSKLVEGAIYLVAPKQANRTTRTTVAPKQTQVGQAFPVDTNNGIEWLLYRADDRNKPGSFPPLSLRDMDIIGRAVAFARPFPPQVLGAV